jgi:hypothetical protein
MDLRALRKTAELLAHIKKPTHVILNAISPNASVSDEAARTITDEFNLPVADIRLGYRVAYSRCTITGLTAPEYEPSGKAARELAKLYKRLCRLVDMPATKGAGMTVDFKQGLRTIQEKEAVKRHPKPAPPPESPDRPSSRKGK